VQAFLDRHAAFALLPLARAWPQAVAVAHGASPGAAPCAPPPGCGETLALTPRQHGTDGFFAAVLERAA